MTARYLTIALIFACAARGVPPQSEEGFLVPGELFKLTRGESKLVAGTDLTVRFLRLVADSRCPAEVSCVWQGDGEIEVELGVGGRQSRVRLHTHGGAQYPSEASFAGYRAKLVDLAPAPANPPRPDSEYVATLAVEKDRP